MSVVEHVQRGEVYGVVRFGAPGGTDDGASERSDQAWQRAARAALVADDRLSTPKRLGQDAKRDLALGIVGARELRPSRGAKGSR